MAHSPKVKICGLSTEETVVACVEAGADFIGFIAYPKSPRHVSPERFASLAPKTGDVPSVLVTVNAEDALLDEYLDLYRPNYVQCHGSESLARLAEIRTRGVNIIKALGVADASDLTKVPQYKDHADILLLDAKPKLGELPGGNAKSFDWSVLEGADLPKNWMLSGGLSAENIDQAIQQTGAPMMDLSSGVESAPGVKEVELIQALMQRVRRQI